MKNLKSHFVLFLAISFIVFSSCNKDENFTSEKIHETEVVQSLQLTPAIATDLQVDNNVLIFKNEKDYRSTVLALNRLSFTEQLNWETELGFTSMQQHFNKVMAAEHTQNADSHSPTYLEAKASGLIYEHDYGYDLNIFNPAYAPILNKNGIVKVGQDIYQFTSGALKIWENGNINNLQPLIQADQPNSQIKFLSVDIHKKPINGFTTPGGAFNWEDQCNNDTGKERIILAGYYYSGYEDVNTPNIIFIKHMINLKSQLNDGNGNWNYDNEANYYMEGNSYTMVEMTDGNDIYQEDIMNDYLKEGTGGNIWIIGNESGEHHSEPMIFTQPAHLMNCQWDAKSEMSTGINLNCQISK